MNKLYCIGEQVQLTLPIYFEGLKKGDKGVVIQFEEYADDDKFKEKKLNRIECMVLFRKYIDKKKSYISINEPFTIAEALMYLEIATEEIDDFFEIKK